jgi:site-specific DNA recombinase
MSNKTQPRPKTIRCAIYTRKSTEEGLDQQFNSLDAQREAAEAYIRSQKCEGWEIVYDRYDDGGFSGGNIERPALKRLMEDIQAGKIDCVVVYKVDRLSRSRSHVDCSRRGWKNARNGDIRRPCRGVGG